MFCRACVVTRDRLYVIGGQEGDFKAKLGSPIFKCSRQKEVLLLLPNELHIQGNYNCITKSDKLHLEPLMLMKALQYCTLLIAGCVWRYVSAGGECKEMEATVKHAQTKLTHWICLGHSEPRYCHCWWLYRKESADQEDGTAGYYLSFQHAHPGELLIHTTCTSSILYFFCIST